MMLTKVSMKRYRMNTRKAMQRSKVLRTVRGTTCLMKLSNSKTNSSCKFKKCLPMSNKLWAHTCLQSRSPSSPTS